MSMLPSLTRTGLRAMVNGNMIDGCGQCCHNKEKAEVPIPFFPKTHRCESVLDDLMKHKIILDPLNIMEDCPFAIRETNVKRTELPK